MMINELYCNHFESVFINSNQFQSNSSQSNLIRFHQAFFRSHQVQSAFRDALISAKLYLFLVPSIIWTSADSAGRRESHVRGLREVATSHGKEAGVLGSLSSPWERSGGPGAAAPGKSGGPGGGCPRESDLFYFCRVVAFLVEVRQVSPLYPVLVRSAPSQLPTEVVA